LHRDGKLSASSPSVSWDIALSEKTFKKLRKESLSEEDWLDSKSTHWVLAYNHRHPLFQLDDSGKLVKRLDPKDIAEIESLDALLPSEEEALSEFSNMYKNAGNPILAGHNVIKFDNVFIQGRLAALKVEPLEIRDSLDTMVFAEALFYPAVTKAPDSAVSKSASAVGNSKSLENLVKVLNVRDGVSHTAAADVRMNVRVLQGMMDTVTEIGKVSISGQKKAITKWASKL
jgi:hypothetical protein